MSLKFIGFNFRNPAFDGPGDRRVLATVIRELQRMITPYVRSQRYWLDAIAQEFKP